MNIELTFNHTISAAAPVFEVMRGQETIGRIWERATTIDPANKWIWAVMDTPGRRLNAALLPSGTAPTLEDAKAKFQAAFEGLILPSIGNRT